MKVINPNGMGGYELHPLDSHDSFDCVQDIEECVRTSCQEYIEIDKQLHFGYIVPGHGKKGKQIEIIIDGDLREMYTRYKRGNEIVLWMKQIASRKRSRTPAESEESSSRKRSCTPTELECSSTSAGRKAGRSNYDKHVEKMSAVDKICDELSDKHGEKYTPEQYRCWANLIQLHKHDSYESPPNKRFFTEKSKGATNSSGVSPSKRINMRSECMSQLDKWYGLKERGIINEEQYKEIQDNIMSDIKKV